MNLFLHSFLSFFFCSFAFPPLEICSCMFKIFYTPDLSKVVVPTSSFFCCSCNRDLPTSQSVSPSYSKRLCVEWMDREYSLRLDISIAHVCVYWKENVGSLTDIILATTRDGATQIETLVSYICSTHTSIVSSQFILSLSKEQLVSFFFNRWRISWREIGLLYVLVCIICMTTFLPWTV